MSFRMQHGGGSQALATEDTRRQERRDALRVARAVADYRRTGRMPDLPPRLLDLFASMAFLETR
jgi:hypothetical protein